MRFLLTLLIALAAARPGAAQDVTAELSCDLAGVKAPMVVEITYVSDVGTVRRRGAIIGLFPLGVRIRTAGTITSPTFQYAFTGENDFADFVEINTKDRFRVQFVLDGPRNGLWLVINPFRGPSYHFCDYLGVR